MFIIVITSFKGGGGKTTSSILMSNAYAASGKSVLVVDLDHQMNTTQYYRRTMSNPDNLSISEALRHNDIYSGILPSRIVGVDIVPGSFKILDYKNESPSIFSALLPQARNKYDVCIVDCPPSLDNIVVGAWQTADIILTPVVFDSFNVEGVRYLRECLVRETTNSIDRWKTVINRFRKPKVTDQYTLDLRYDDVFNHYLDNVLEVRLPESSFVRKAIDDDEPITTANRKAPLYNSVIELASQIVEEPVRPEGGRF